MEVAHPEEAAAQEVSKTKNTMFLFEYCIFYLLNFKIANVFYIAFIILYVRYIAYITTKILPLDLVI